MLKRMRPIERMRRIDPDPVDVRARLYNLLLIFLFSSGEYYAFARGAIRRIRSIRLICIDILSKAKRMPPFPGRIRRRQRAG
jgi:hypothetical protein